MAGNDEAMMTRGTLFVFLAIQIFAAKLLLQRLQDVGVLEIPAWVPFFAHQNCGHLKEYEYVLVSRKIVTPDGIAAAAGEVHSP